MNLSGLICVRQGIELDYCFRESIQSLLPICDKVIVCDGESTDGTQEEIREWSEKEPKLALCVYPWPNPKGVPNFWVDWLQYGRGHVPPGFLIQLDADEVLSEKSYQQIRDLGHERRSYWCRRYNFWRDEKHLIPEGVCCSHRVVRIIPQDVFLPSDGEDVRGHEAVNMAQDSGIEIFHYGFLRNRQAFFKKARALQGMFFDTYDPRLEKAEEFEGNWMEMPGLSGWENNLTPFTGEHPKIMQKWIKERRYVLPKTKSKPTGKRPVRNRKVSPSD